MTTLCLLEGYLLQWACTQNNWHFSCT